ncbi:MAG: flagellar basal-body MS-ring/collar protein FliF [Leptospirales bacterium]
MPDFKKIFDNLVAAVKKLDTTKRIVLGAVALTVIISLALIGSISGSDSRTVLFKNLEVSEFAKISQKLGEMNYHFSSSGTDTIFVDPNKFQEIIVALSQEDMIPAGVPAWELFDEEKWSETQYEKEIKKTRALSGAISRTLAKLKPVEKADVSIAFPKADIFTDTMDPVTAGVVVHYIPGVDKLSKKEVEGIVTLISRAVTGLKKENISIIGPNGEELNNFDDIVEMEKWELESVTRKMKIEEKQRIKLLNDIRKSLDYAYGADRADIVRLDVRLNWDKEVIDAEEYTPIVKRPDNPETPYSELETQDNIQISSKDTKEEFQGKGFTPEGPAGTEANIPPGYKDVDYQKSNYIKTETIHNNVVNKTIRKIDKQLWERESVNLAVILDGHWKRKGINEEGDAYIREYTEISDEEIANVTTLLKNAVGYSIARGDQVSVKHIKKDRTAEHYDEDEELRKKQAFRKMLMATLFSLLGLVIIVIVYQVVRREIEKRRRMKEEELAAQQQMMREAALRAIEDEGVEVELSLEEKARKEMIENAINLAKDRPEEVAQLLRTWLAED